MSQQISLKEFERKAFRTMFNDGLWDVFLGCFFLLFAIAPVLSPVLGDFWSSAVFLPFWGLVYLAIYLIRKHVVAERVGMVKLGPARKARLTRFTLVMLIVNVAALVLGFAALMSWGKVPSLVFPILLGMILLAGFSVAAYLLDVQRLCLYGLLVGLAPLVGKWLWTRGYTAHHGYPVTYGVAAGVMVLAGLVIFLRLLRRNPAPVGELPIGRA